MRDDYRYVVTLSRPDGPPLGDAAIQPDWAPAIEWTRLVGLRTHGRWVDSANGERAVEPIWHEALGEPHLAGVRIWLGESDDDRWSADFPIAYFADQARTASEPLVASGVLKKGDRFHFRVAAFPHDSLAAHRPLSLVTTDAVAEFPVCETPVAPWLERSGARGACDSDDLEVFVARQVVDEAAAWTREAGDRETGGVLIGRLHRDPDSRCCFIDVAAQLPARHTRTSSVTLTFTSDTWTDVRAALSLRGRQELMLGWWHSHPAFAWCAKCPPEHQRTCRLSQGFLSPEDLALHRTMFPRAFTLALVMTHTAAGVEPALFGWRSGVMAPRGFHVI
jgi:hypothetical protein